jgi:NADPH:quinone reductase-like Zn-dependent oxidoreductase
MTTMKAVLVHEAGGAQVLKIEDRPVPDPKPGWVQIRVRAFGLNRSELFTRQGHSPNVTFPGTWGSRRWARSRPTPRAGSPSETA